MSRQPGPAPLRAPLVASFALVALLAACRGPEERAPAVPELPPGQVTTFPEIYKRVSPAVVSIYAAEVADRPMVLPDMVTGPARPMVRSMSSGSGFLISADGHIVTNDHVIGQSNRVVVVMQDGRRTPARIVGRDPATDLAVLRIPGRDHPFVSFSKAKNPEVGESVIAIGNPFGLGSTATAGIISAYGRDIGSAYVDFVQLDAPINQGNSGGPTFNARGEVVGVNTAIFSPSGAFAGIGFAIPAGTAAEVTRQLMEAGRVERGFIGASIGDLRNGGPPGLDAGRPGGAVVADVVSGGPAARGGLRSGDLIVAIDGEDVDGAADVIRRVTRAGSDEVLRMSIVRGGARVELTIQPERRAAQ